MNRRIGYQGEQFVSYEYCNPLAQPLGRITEFMRPYRIPELTYNVDAGIKLINLIGIRRSFAIVPDTLPFDRIQPFTHFKTRLRALAPSDLRLEGCWCLLTHNRWYHSFYHWFIDLLPRVFAAEHWQRLSGRPCRLLIPAPLLGWQEEALQLLGYSTDPAAGQCRTLARGEPRVVSVETLLTTSSHRLQRSDSCPRDAVSPITLQALRDRLSVPGRESVEGLEGRFFVSRSRAAFRRIVNEPQLLEMLSRYGFRAICVEDFSFRQQIALFRDASHVIAVHGAALANLVHSRDAKVLEICAEGHGVRPDYFQIAAANSLCYSHLVAPSVNVANDIFVDVSEVEAFLKRFWFL